METKASLRGVHLSAQKGRLIADLIRGKKVDQALDILSFTPKKGAAIIKQVLEAIQLHLKLHYLNRLMV